MQIKVDENK